MDPTTSLDDALGQLCTERGFGAALRFLLSEYDRKRVGLAVTLAYAEHAAARLEQYEEQRRDVSEILRGTGTERQKLQRIVKALGMQRAGKRNPYDLERRWAELTYPGGPELPPLEALETLRAEGFGASVDAVLKALLDIRARNRQAGIERPKGLPQRRVTGKGGTYL